MKRVLVAEDHAAIAATYKLILESESAYEVVVAKNGQECIETYDRFYIGTNTGTNQQELEGRNVGTGAFDASPIRSASNPFDLVVLDYHMPQKDGIDVAKHILSKAPYQRILIASSYPRENIIRSAEILNRSVELMLKPFDLEEFADTVEGVRHVETIGGKRTQNNISQPNNNFSSGTANQRPPDIAANM